MTTWIGRFVEEATTGCHKREDNRLPLVGAEAGRRKVVWWVVSWEDSAPDPAECKRLERSSNGGYSNQWTTLCDKLASQESSTRWTVTGERD